MRELCARAAMGVAYEKNWSADFARKEITEVWTDAEATMRHARSRRVTIAELKEMTAEQLHSLGFHKWDKDLRTIALWAWNYVADGETLVCIDGTKMVKGIDEIDLDVRSGCIAFGFIQ